MPSWISEHRADILFVFSLIAGVALITVGLVQGDSPSILLGAGALGIPGFQTASGGDK